ncbi:hypothetical protein [Sulfurovum sp. TSL1]|uniref:hypothetical protein n=1 Tax=Sulfurovum sp. TSL1 TaxID=2826994 RepID=UPI001CC60C2F|nr:hypothetical protein [Sulfurovum sp. TSL1]GIT98829.1 hypothetical protein TSL1_16500 [Sulfurovum sp. TSL1]
MQKFIVGAFIGLAMLAFIGCTKNNTVESDTKCSTSTKCEGTTKCSGDRSKAVTTKCDASKKCG